MEKWYADFKERDNVTDFARSKWDDQRDLVIDSFDAYNKEHARARAFEIAEEHLDQPMLGTLKRIEMQKGQTRPNVSGPVLGLLQERANKATSIQMLVKKTGFSADQIRSAISHYNRKDTEQIETIQRGHMWRWVESESETVEQPQTEKEKEMAEQVDAYVNSDAPVEPNPEEDEKGFYMLNTAKDGALILQRDCDGTIWKAERL